MKSKLQTLTAAGYSVNRIRPGRSTGTNRNRRAGWIFRFPDGSFPAGIYWTLKRDAIEAAYSELMRADRFEAAVKRTGSWIEQYV